MVLRFDDKEVPCQSLVLELWSDLSSRDALKTAKASERSGSAVVLPMPGTQSSDWLHVAALMYPSEAEVAAVTWDNLELLLVLSDKYDIPGVAIKAVMFNQAMKRTLPDMARPYIDSWTTIAGVTEGMKNTRIKYLTGQLPTAKNLKRYKKRKSDTCPCCNKHPDSGHHAVAWCPGIMPMVQDKHNTAVRIITKAIASGDRGADSIVYNDGGNAAKWARSGAAHLHKTQSVTSRPICYPKHS